MIRQLARFILLIFIGIWAIVSKHPGPSLGVMIGAIIGYILGKSMVVHGFPEWSLPAMVILFAVKMAVVAKQYFDKLAK